MERKFWRISIVVDACVLFRKFFDYCFLCVRFPGATVQFHIRNLMKLHFCSFSITNLYYLKCTCNKFSCICILIFLLKQVSIRKKIRHLNNLSLGFCLWKFNSTTQKLILNIILHEWSGNKKKTVRGKKCVPWTEFFSACLSSILYRSLYIYIYIYIYHWSKIFWLPA